MTNLASLVCQNKVQNTNSCCKLALTPDVIFNYSYANFQVVARCRFLHSSLSPSLYHDNNLTSVDVIAAVKRRDWDTTSCVHGALESVNTGWSPISSNPVTSSPIVRTKNKIVLLTVDWTVPETLRPPRFGTLCRTWRTRNCPLWNLHCPDPAGSNRHHPGTRLPSRW